MTTTKTKVEIAPVVRTINRHSIEYFHIYTDETINKHHRASLNYLRAADQVWNFERDHIILIDNYNPTEHTLSVEAVLDYLAEQGLSPRYWAYEADFVDNAKLLLESVTDKKLKKSYTRYIADHGKFPCSLLTASWYLTRLGIFDGSMIHSTDPTDTFEPATRLINILPEAYKSVEMRAHSLIARSEYGKYQDKIQDLFYAASAHRKIDLF